MSRRRPDPTRFVIRDSDRERLEKALSRAPDVEVVEDGDEFQVVETAQAEGDPRSSWQRLRDSLGAESVVLPVLRNEKDQNLYPTGAVQVRFSTAPSDEAVDEFAKTHRLRVVERNRYQPSQVRFEPAEPAATYLPETVADLRRANGVRDAWEETESRYER